MQYDHNFEARLQLYLCTGNLLSIRVEVCHTLFRAIYVAIRPPIVHKLWMLTSSYSNIAINTSSSYFAHLVDALPIFRARSMNSSSRSRMALL